MDILEVVKIVWMPRPPLQSLQKPDAIVDVLREFVQQLNLRSGKSTSWRKNLGSNATCAAVKMKRKVSQ
ncbi:hypothetical protein PC129_g13832 [Phytophthora cactorum]|uniref:Uncharacterized protein n=1 Tax=Phytophthora cactorum TaxID=29920 RepID=A0A8T1HR65_9STRA|nr:hypothetical protein PC129_g13832 [Phytophthora cactorum]